MSDVERICEVNFQRVRWAEEYAAVGRIATGAGALAMTEEDGGRGLPRRQSRLAMTEETDCHGRQRVRNDRRGRKDKQRRIFRTASLGCAMFCGMGTAYLGLGVAMWHLPTMVAGIVAAVVFLVAGWRLDEKVEEMTV